MARWSVGGAIFAALVACSGDRVQRGDAEVPDEGPTDTIRLTQDADPTDSGRSEDDSGARDGLGSAEDTGSGTGILASEIVFQRVDQPLAVSQTARIVVVTRNNGTRPWTGPGFGLSNDLTSSWGVSSSSLLAGEVIEPGGVRAFAFRVTAPPGAGDFLMSWRMRDELGIPFGQTATRSVSVVDGPTYAIRDAPVAHPGCDSTRAGELSCPNRCPTCDLDPIVEGVDPLVVPLPWSFEYFREAISGPIVASTFGTAAFGGDTSDPSTSLPIPSTSAPTPLISAVGRSYGYDANNLPSAEARTGLGGEFLEILWPYLTLPGELVRAGSAALRLYEESGIIELELFGDVPAGPRGLEAPDGASAALAMLHRTLFLPSWRGFIAPADLVILNVDYPRALPPGADLPLSLTLMNIGELATGPIEVLGSWHDCNFGSWIRIASLNLQAGAIGTVTATVNPSQARCVVLPLSTEAPGAYSNAIPLDPIGVIEPDAGVPDADAAQPAPDSGARPDAGPSDCGAPVATEYSRCDSHRTPSGLVTTCTTAAIPAQCLPFPTCECLGGSSAFCNCSGDACSGLGLNCYSP